MFLRGGVERIAVKGLLWILIVLLLGLAVLLAGATWEVRQKQQIAFSEKENARTQYEETLHRKGTLDSRVDELSHDRGMEEEFRERFPVAREGEEVVVLVDAETSVLDTVSESDPTLWQQVRNWLRL